MISFIRYALMMIIIICFILVFLFLFFRKIFFIDILSIVLNKIENNKIIRTTLLLFFFLLSSSYLFLPGIIEGHDLNFRLSHINAISNEISKGIFPAFILSDYLNGYGLGLGLFYSDLFYYIPAILCCMGIPILISYKIFLLLIIFFSMISVSFCIKKMTSSSFLSFLSGIACIMSSYFFTDLYIRAEPGELLSFVFVPLVILGLYNISFGNEKEGYYFTIGLIGLLYGHILSCLLTALMVVVFFFINLKVFLYNKERLKYLFIYGLFSLGITSFFWVPMFEQFFSNTFGISNYVDINISRGAVNPLFSFFEFFYGVNQYEKWIPPGIGAYFYSFLIFCILKNSYFKNNQIGNQFIFLGMFFWFLSTTLAPWDILNSILSIMEFPWRFYLFSTVFLEFGFNLIFYKSAVDENDKIKILLITIVSSILTFSLFTYNLFFYEPMYTNKYSIHYPVGNGAELPSIIDREYLMSIEPQIKTNNNIEFSSEKQGTKVIVAYNKNIYDDSYFEIPLIYYKGYKYTDNGEVYEASCNNNGLVKVFVNHESGIINVYYGFTIIRTISLFVTSISIASFVFYILKQSNKKSISGRTSEEYLP